MHAKLFTCLLLILACGTVRSQKVFFEQLTTAEGLPSDYVNQVFEDSKGFLWIATDKGACRYDGKEFRLFNKDNGLPNNYVICFAEDKHGQIWMGTYDGICKVVENNIIAAPFLKQGFPKRIFQVVFNPDNSFFVVTWDHETYFFENEQSTPKILFNNLHYITPIGRGKFLTCKKDQSNILVKTKEGFELKNGAENKIHSELIKPWLCSNNFLASNKSGFSVYESKDEHFILKKKIQLKTSIHLTDIKDYDIDEGKILVATTNGLLYVDEKGREYFLDSKNGLGADYVNSICRDKQGNIYICTLGAGIKMWTGLYLEQLAVEGKITSIHPTNKGIYLTTTQRNYEYSIPGHRLSAFNSIEKGNFTNVYRSPSGEIYLGSLVNYYRIPNESAWEELKENTQGKYLQLANTGTSGFLFRNNKLYVSTYGDGVMVLDKFGKPMDTLDIESGIVESLVPLLHQMAALNYSTGLVLIDSLDQYTRINRQNGLLSNSVYSVFQDREDELWIGTQDGVNHYAGNRVTRTFSYAEGFIGSRAICIFRDNSRRLWVLSDKFLHLVEGNKLRTIRSHPILFDPKNSINRAAYHAQTDQLFIGMTDVLMVADFRKIKIDTSLYSPTISSLFLDTARIYGDPKSISISPDIKRISVRFSDHTRFMGGHPRLLYKFEPFDEDWKLLDDNLEAIYQKLPAGNYHLFAKTVNADGFSSEILKLQSFEVLPPFWKKAWFVFLTICVLVTIFYLSGHYISKGRYKRRLRILEAEYRLQLERERIARELHDNVGSQLTYLINKIDDDHPLLADVKEANKLSAFARGTMQELRETIWALDKKEILPAELENKIRQLVQLYRERAHAIELHWMNNNYHHPTSMNSLKALNIYRIIQEALNNANKYSGASVISVRAEQINGLMNISISDNGKGFEPGGVKEGYGLKNMQKRAEEIKSEFKVTSILGKGTTINLRVPSS